jgi:hypothetical protein
VLATAATGNVELEGEVAVGVERPVPSPDAVARAREVARGAARAREVARGAARAREVAGGAVRAREVAGGAVRAREVAGGAVRARVAPAGLATVSCDTTVATSIKAEIMRWDLRTVPALRRLK